MGSEQNDSTSFTQSTEPKLCANGCGFFGSPSNMDLCSKCYRNICAEEAQTAVAKAAVEKSFNKSPPPSPRPRPTLVIAEPADKEKAAVVVADVAAVVSEPSLEEAVSPVADESGPSEPPARPGRCLCCNKKVGILGFKCKCGSTFCGEHRYPERHECSFDFKGIGRGEIAKANPLVKADKLQRF